ncbi:DUF4215 domain-containing protein [Myxococcota bacterium]|nr:DUF4215 domain-containing protein [Myxococcota bacterium]
MLRVHFSLLFLCLSGWLTACTPGGAAGPFCGDGKVLAPEECDPPGVGACDAQCMRDPALCGDGQCQNPEHAGNCPADCTPACGNGFREEGEDCDGDDLNGATCTSLGYAGGTLVCAPDCTFGVIVCETLCGDGLLDAGEDCDDGNRQAGDGCGATCAQEDGWHCAGTPSVCTAVCGDGIVVGNELCDGDELGGWTCRDQGFYEGTLSCAAGCLSLDTAGCSGSCGDNVIQAGEEDCDGGNLGGATCSSMGWPGGGPLACSMCAFDASTCGRWTTVGIGGGQTCAIKSDGSAWCWGFNGDGRLGDGTFTDRSRPVQVTGFAQGSTAAGGVFHSCAVKTTGAAFCWGQGSDGQLGNGGTNATANPVAVTSLSSGVLRVGAGGYHSCALKSDGSVWCWGRNAQGQLGDGTNVDRLTPVQVTGISGATALSTSGNHTCVIDGGGGVRCWGSNQFGQLGDGATSDRNTPFSVSSLTSGVVSLGAGQFHTCAVKSDGSAWCWGYNLNGRLGDGTVANRSTPVQVLGFSGGVATISAGGQQTCAVKTDGGAWCWGRNQYGQLGDGTTGDRYEPVAVTGLGSGVAGVFSGGAHNCALLASGAIHCWGNNESGRLGDGSTTNRSTPVPVIFQ